MSEEDNIRIVEELFEALNAQDLGQGSKYQAPGYTYQGPGLPGPVGPDGYAAYMQVYYDAFPDLHFELTHKVAQGDVVIVNWMGTGTHDGPLRMPNGDSLPATGKKGTNFGSSTFEFDNDKVVRSSTYFDTATMLAQLGVALGM